MDQRTTNDIPRDLAPALVERLPALLREVAAVLAARYPDYAWFVEEEFDEIVAGARTFVGRLLDLAGPQPTDLEQALFEEIGRIHHRQGLDITRLLAAYRIGATVAWRHVSAAAVDLGTPTAALVALADAVFAAVDHLSSASLRGYVPERADTAQARERQCEELAALLLSDRSDSTAVRAAAERCGWPLPRLACLVLTDRANDVARDLLPRLHTPCLHLHLPDTDITVVPDPTGPGRRQRLAAALRGTGAVVGIAVPLDRLPASRRLTELALRLRHEHVLDGDPVFVDQHLDTIIVRRDRPLLAAVRRHCLSPMNGLPPATRDRLSTTLGSWLLHLGDRRAVAAELHVHPQTVRYRLTQLRELFGPALDDPASRRALLLALVWGGDDDRGACDE
jgi:PucR C-terminal helix-turn-helix domain